MRDITDDGRNEMPLPPHHMHTLEPVSESTATTSTHGHKTRTHSVSKPTQQQQQRTLTEKRSQSSTTLNPPSLSLCHLKHASTSNLSRSPKERSKSVCTQPITSVHPTSRKMSQTPVHGDQPEQQRTSTTITSQHRQRKYNSTKT